MIKYFPPDDTETLTASGEYVYFCNGEQQAITEPWTIHKRGDAQIVRSRRLAADYGVAITAITLAEADGNTQAALVWQSSANNQDLRREVSIDLASDLFSYQLDDGDIRLVETTAAYRLFPLMRIYMGEVLDHLVTLDGPGNLLIPNIKDPSDTATLLTPELTERRAVLVKSTSVDIDGRAVPAKLYDYTGDQYESGSCFYVDERGVLLKYTWRQSGDADWDVTLKNYNWL